MIYIALNMKSKLSPFTFLKHVPFRIVGDSLEQVITEREKNKTKNYSI